MRKIRLLFTMLAATIAAITVSVSAPNARVEANSADFVSDVKCEQADETDAEEIIVE